MVNPISNHNFREFKLPDGVSKVEREQSLENMKQFYGDPVKMNLHQFALLHGDTFLKGDDLEGGNAADAIAFWKELLQLWKEGKGLSPELTNEEIDRALADYVDVSESESLINRKQAAALNREIKNRIEERNRYALLLKVTGKKGGTGHVFGCILERGADEKIRAHILNKGDGAELHPILVVTETKDKCAYRYPPIVYEKGILNSSIWEDLCQRIVRYATETPDDEVDDYHSSELYAIFAQYGKIDDKYPFHPNDAVTMQRSGTCSSQVAKLLLRSATDSNVRKNKRLSFCARFQSFVSLLKGGEIDLHKPEDQHIVQQALQGFCVQIEKLKKANLISDEELVLSRLLVEDVQKKLDEMTTVLPDFIEFKPNAPVHLDFEYILPNNNTNKVVPFTIGFNIAPELVPLTDPQQLNATLEQWLGYVTLGWSSANKKVHFVHQALRMLPPPHANFWDQVQDCKKTMTQLHKLVGQAFEEISAREQDHEQRRSYQPMIALIGMTTYAYLARLAYRIPELKLDNWSVSLYLDGYGCDFFLHGWEQERFDSIKKYFKSIKKGRKTILLISEANFGYELFEKSCKHADSNEDPHNTNMFQTLLYIKQFFQYVHCQGSISRASCYIQVWQWLQNKYPSFAQLQDFALFMKEQNRVIGIHYSIEQCGDDGLLKQQEAQIKTTFRYHTCDKMILPSRNRYRHPEITAEISPSRDSKPENELAMVVPNYLNNWKDRSLYQEVEKCNKEDYVSEDLIIPSVLTIMRQYPEALSKDYFRQWMMRKLLHGDHVTLAAKRQPSLIDTLRKELLQTIRYFRGSPHNRKLALEWIRLAYFVETRMQEPQLDKLRSECTWIKQDEKTTADDRYKACCMTIIFLGHLNHLSDEEIQTALLARVEGATTAKDPSKDFSKWEESVTSIIVHHESAICKRADENTGLYQSALVHLSKTLGNGQKWEGNFPKFYQSNVEVLIHEGKITIAGASASTGIWDQSFCAVSPETISSLYAPFLPPYYVNRSEKSLIATNGKVIAHVSERYIHRIEHYKSTFPEPGWYSHFPNSRMYYPMFVSKYKLWIPQESKTMDFLLEKDQLPIAFGFRRKIFRIDANGKSTGEELVNLERTKANHSCIQLCKSFTSNYEKELLVWQRDGKITSLYWQTHDLKLIVEGNKICPAKYPDYHLTTEPFDNLPSTKVFRNAEGQKLVGISYNAKRSHKDIPEKLCPTPCHKDQYFFYPVCEKTGRLSHQDALPLIHLFFFYASQHQYFKAKELLDSWNRFSHYGFSLYDIFDQSIERTKMNPAQAALYAHLALHMIEVSEMVVKERWNVEEENLYSEFMNEILAPHILFLRKVISSYQLHRIPHDLTLTQEQIKKLETTIGIELQKSEEKAIDIRPKELDLKSVSDLPTQKLKLGESKYAPDWTQVRWTRKEVLGQFGTLYCDCHKSDRDNPRQWIIRNSLMGMEHSGEDCKKIARFLRIVRESSHLFPPFILLEEKLQRNLEFSKCINIANGIANESRVQSIVYNSLQILSASPKIDDKKRGITLRPLPDCCNHSHPLDHLGLVIQNESSVEGGFPLHAYKPKTKLAQKLLNSLKEAYSQRETERIYTVDRTQCKHKLNALIEQDETAVKEMKKEIISLANWTPEAGEEGMTLQELIHASSEQHRLIGNKKEQFTWKLLLLAFMSQSQGAMTQHNPFLQPTQIREIYEKMAEVFVISSRIDQAKESLQALKRGATDQELGTILDKRRTYDPAKQPLFLVYEYMTGMMLRPNQVKLLNWIFNKRDGVGDRELLVEFQAGGGKTKVISAILAFQAQQKGKLPVFFSLPALHDVTKKDLADALISVFRKKVKVLEITLERSLDEGVLRHICDLLKGWLVEGVCLQMVPETWHALNLALRFAQKNGNAIREALALEIITFFKQKAFFIIDEAHRNAESLWQANIATGNPKPIPQKEQQLFITCYRFLLQDKQLLLNENNQAMLTEEKLKAVLNRLADHLIDKYKINPQWKKGLLNQKEPFPVNSDDDRDDDQWLYLARGLLSQIFPAALKMVHSYDYGKGLKNEVEGPRYQRKPTTSQYECADLAAALSCQGLFQRGLDCTQIRLLLSSLLNRHLSHPGVHLDPTSTPMSQKFAQWVGEEGPQLYHLEGQMDDDAVIEELIEKIGHHEEVVVEYLLEHLLPQIRVFPEKVSSTAVDLVEGCENGLLFSATMGLPEEYPQEYAETEEHPVMDDHLFQAKVIGRACEPQNSELHILDPNSPTKLFEDLHTENKPFTFEGIIDVGGWTRDYSTQEVAEQFLAFAVSKDLPYDGAIFIVENLSVVDAEQNLMYLGKGETKPIALQGSDLKKALKGAGIGEIEELKLFKVYGASQCTGTDLKLSSKANMLVTVGETTRLWSLIQGIMRARQFLLPLSKQTMTWICPKPLIGQIPYRESLHPADIFMWALEREAESIESRIVARAFQQITGEVQAFVENSNGDSIELFQEHASAFVVKLGRDLRALYAEQGKKIPTEEVLNAFTQGLLKAAKVENFDRWETIKKIVDETKALVPEITRPEGTPSKGAAQQKVQAKNQSKSKQKHKGVEKRQGRQTCHLQPAIQAPYPIKHLYIYSPNLVEEAKSLNSLHQSKFFDPDLLYLPNAIKTFTEPDFILKKLSYFLLTIEENGGVHAIAISMKDADFYRKQIYQGPQWARNQNRSVTKREVALVTTAGVIAQHRMSEENLTRIRESAWWTKILSDLNFLNGRIHNVEFFSKQIATWRKEWNFAQFWKWIQEVQGTPKGMHLQAVNTFLDPELTLLEELGPITPPKPILPIQLDETCPPEKDIVKQDEPTPIIPNAQVGANESITKETPPSSNLTFIKVCTIAAAIFATLSLSFAVYMGTLPLLTAIPIACALAILPLAYLFFHKLRPS